MMMKTGGVGDDHLLGVWLEEEEGQGYQHKPPVIINTALAH